MTDPTEAVRRVREKLDRVAGSDFAESHYWEMRSKDFADVIAAIHEDDLRALLAAYDALAQENADLWTELNLCRQMCRDSQPARLPGDHHGT